MLCATVVAVSERRALRAAYTAPSRRRLPLSAAERRAVLSLLAATLAAWASPFVGVAPWWPFVGAVAVSLALGRERPRLVVPWRISTQVAGLLILTQALKLHALTPIAVGLPVLAIIAISIGAACAVANNLPVSVGAAALLTSGPSAYSASIGLAVGSLATPQGSVATLIAAELAGTEAKVERATRLRSPRRRRPRRRRRQGARWRVGGRPAGTVRRGARRAARP
jgi:hypothetical protein